MFSTYLKIAYRSIIKNKVSSFINISGLAIGLTCVILILLYVQDELKYDRFFKDSDRIFQVYLSGNLSGEEFTAGNTPPPVGNALVTTFPEVETFTRLFDPGDEIVRYKQPDKAETYFTESQILAVDSNFFKIFNYSLSKGDDATCLQNPNTVVLTKQAAKKYFGKQEPVGKLLLFGNDRTPYLVTAVLDDVPAQSSFQFDMLTSMSSYPQIKAFGWSWVWTMLSTFVKVDEKTASDKVRIEALEAKFPAMVATQAASAFEKIGQPFDEFKKKGGKWDFHLQPISKAHLTPETMTAAYSDVSDSKYVYIFLAIAFIIIILACVNFMSLSTAQSSKRAKEVGIRKVAGSVRGQLIRQFLIEALLYSFLSTLVAIVLTGLLLKPFNLISAKELSLNLILENYNWLLIAAVTVLTGLLAGSYPAFYLTKFRPVDVLKGANLSSSNPRTLSIRNALVVFQFTVSTSLIICTIIVYQQIKFARNKDIGFDKENVIVITNGERLGNKDDAFKQELLKLPQVLNVASSSGVPAGGFITDFYIPEQTPGAAKDLILSSFVVDNNFVSTLRINIIKGRRFLPEFADSNSVILNEAAVKQIGWKGNPIGKYLTYPGGNDIKFKVIGITSDFNIQSLHTAVTPFALFHSSSKAYDMGTNLILAKVKAEDMSNTLAALELKWKTLTANTPFDYTFLDNDIDAFYQSEKRMGTVFGVLTILSIFVGCLGLFGLVAYTTERRTKEIGIRKVLGASVQALVQLLSKDFIKLVLIAALLAFPIAWWVINKWLEAFSYRTDISWTVFIAATLAILFIALLTVSLHVIKAATANPVKSLKTE